VNLARQTVLAERTRLSMSGCQECSWPLRVRWCGVDIEMDAQIVVGIGRGDLRVKVGVAV
jgi:hypothetical protein